MANDLIPRPPEEGDEEWKAAHAQSRLVREHARAQKVKDAERDASRAGRAGELVFAFMRREDARAQVQARWDWGDGPTWVIVAILCAIGLFLAITACVLPQGRHDTPPLIRLY